MRDEDNAKKLSVAYKPLHEKYAPRIESLTLSLKGFYFKIAQILSTRDDFLAMEYMTWAKRLQNKSSSMLPSEDVLAIVEDGLQMSAEELFSEWDEEPIGAASVGQVHRARLKTGEEVAVKVQYPGIERKFRNDIDTVELFCKYLMPQQTAYFAEMKRQFATEFDMRGEAENLQEVHENLHKSGWDRHVAVPFPLHSSKDVLIMTYLAGDRLVDGLRAHFERVARRCGKSLEEFEREQKRMAGGRREVRDALVRGRHLEWMMWLRGGVVNGWCVFWNWVVRPVVGGEVAEMEGTDMVNLGEVMERLLRVHGHEIFVDGAFNGDPHPGNILLLRDGRLGLVDYGQVKRMRVSDRIIYAKLMVALSREDAEEVVRIMTEEVGLKTRRMDAEVIYRATSFFHCRDSEDVLQGMNVSEFMEWIERTDGVQAINDEFVMVGRVSLLLRGLANAFGMKVRISDYWKEDATAFLKSQGIDY